MNPHYVLFRLEWGPDEIISNELNDRLRRMTRAGTVLKLVSVSPMDNEIVVVAEEIAEEPR